MQDDAAGCLWTPLKDQLSSPATSLSMVSTVSLSIDHSRAFTLASTSPALAWCGDHRCDLLFGDQVVYRDLGKGPALQCLHAHDLVQNSQVLQPLFSLKFGIGPSYIIRPEDRIRRYFSGEKALKEGGCRERRPGPLL